MSADRFSELNDEHIARWARDAGAQLKERGVAEVVLTPGDATAYRIIVLPPGRPVGTEEGGNWSREYMVILATSFGKSYPWTGHAMHGDYCDDKWCIKGNGWTGEVMARFLTALAAHVPAVG